MISDYLKAIVGFEIKVEDIQAKYKLSQNRSTADHQKIVAELQNTQDPNAQKVADEMIRIKII
jgi:transcriptional regulator